MTAVTSVAPYLSLLEEPDVDLKVHALESIYAHVDDLWAEIANKINDIEDLFDDDSFTHRSLAALVASKIYYNLGDYDSAVKYALYSGDSFNTNEQSEFVQTIVSKCIEKYIQASKLKFSDASVQIDPQLTKVFESMLDRCVKNNDIKLALGIAIESYRLDIVSSMVSNMNHSNVSEEQITSLLTYVLEIVTTVIDDIKFKNNALNETVGLLLNLPNPDYFIITKVIVQLNDSLLAHRVFKDLLNSSDKSLIAYQVAFDLVSVASQDLLTKSIQLLNNDPKLDSTNEDLVKVTKILSGVPTCDLDITFLSNNNKADVNIINATKKALDGRNSLYHSAVTFASSFMFSGTTDDSFYRSNLDWLGKANNWSKFSATAAFGAIHMGNLAQGKAILDPYLPGNTSNAFTNGGSLYGLGLIYAGQQKEVLDYLKGYIMDNYGNVSNDDIDITVHGACLGLGISAMGLSDESLCDDLKSVLFADSAIASQAAALALGLVMVGTGNEELINDMITYAQETKHETIIRGLCIAIALICFGQENAAESTIEQLLESQDAMLRYGACYTIGLAYCGTSNKLAIKRLLHIAVSDSNDNVRRAAVMNLGFILLKDYTKVPTVVELLSQSHNPYVRYGAAMALGISCSGRALKAAVDVLEPLCNDQVDFVRQGATIATSMILIQQNEKTYPAVKEFREKLSKSISNKHEEALARFGSTISQGILDAGGRNVSIQLENIQTNTLNTKAIVGLTIFTQHWYWYPLTHFLNLSFTPTSIMAITKDLKVPKLKINCHAKEDVFDYPPKMEIQVEKQKEKVSTAVLSTTNRSRRVKKAKKIVKDEDAMDIDGDEKKNEEDPEKKSNEEKSDEPKDGDDTFKSHYVEEPYQFENMTRVVPAQMKYVTFSKTERFQPVRKFKGLNGVVVVADSKEGEEFEDIKILREKSISPEQQQQQQQQPAPTVAETSGSHVTFIDETTPGA